MSFYLVHCSFYNFILQIYGGGDFNVNTGLDITVHNLLAVYSGGRLDLSGAGYQPDTVEAVFDGPSPGVGMLTLLSLF